MNGAPGGETLLGRTMVLGWSVFDRRLGMVRGYRKVNQRLDDRFWCLWSKDWGTNLCMVANGNSG
jgi:hypothetical protein